MRILTSQKAQPGSFIIRGVEGKLWRYRPTQDGQFSVPNDLREMEMPAGVGGVLRRPSWRNYNIGQRSRLVGTGAWTNNILVDELMRAMRQGIQAPFTIPSVAAAAGPGPSGQAICYIRWLDSLGGRVSPKSAPAPAVTLANQSRAWTNLPTTCLDSSVDSIQGMVSMDGANPRVAWTRQLGVTAVTEAVATLALNDPDPGEFVDMPLGSMNEVYHERQWVSGNDRFPQRTFASALGELERHEGLYVDTDGEWVNGLFTQNDLLFIGSFQKIYRVAGYTEGDISREIEKPDVGIVGPHSIVNLHKRSIVATTPGFQMYDGQWHYLMDDRRTEWAREYKLYREYYERAQSYYHPLRGVFMFGPVPHSQIQGWVHWVLDAKRLIPEIEADEFAVAWSNDAFGPASTTRATFYLPGSSEPQVACGTEYGHVIDDNVPGADDDLSDDSGGEGSYKAMTITPATVLPDPGGGPLDANTFHRVWVYLTAPQNSYRLIFKTGGEQCAFNGASSLEFVISALEDLNDGEPTTSRAHLLEGCAGEAFSLTIQLPDNLNDPPAVTSAFRGFGLTYSPGIKARLAFDGGDPG